MVRHIQFGEHALCVLKKHCIELVYIGFLIGNFFESVLRNLNDYRVRVG